MVTTPAFKDAVLRLANDPDFEKVCEHLAEERKSERERLLTLALDNSKSTAGVAGRVKMLDEILTAFRAAGPGEV